MPWHFGRKPTRHSTSYFLAVFVAAKARSSRRLTRCFCRREKLARRDHAASDSELSNSQPIGAVEEFDRVSFKIEADGAIRTVVDDDSHSPTERRKFTAPSLESLTEPVEGLSKEGGGGQTKVEIKPQQNIHADESGHKDGLGYLSFG
jgi:hypothetical protein